VTRLRDANTVPRGTSLAADVCIVGGGAAGITLALELAKTSTRVVLLESGNTTFDDATQALYDGASTGDTYDVSASRLRVLGGSTNHWAGWCRPLDPADFEPRSWIRNSGWPITRADVDPYYTRALPIVGIAQEPFDGAYWIRQRPEASVVPILENATMTTSVFRFSPGPFRFGEKYREDLERADNVDVYLDANVVNVATGAGSAPRVTHVEVATLKGNRFRVGATVFVLALGGIENARMLLASTDSRPRGLGNDNDLVGRYFMDHPEGDVGTVVLTGKAPDNFLGGRIDALRTMITFRPEVFEKQRMNAIAFVVASQDTKSVDITGKIRSSDVAAVLRATEGASSVPYLLYMRGEPEPNPDSRVTLGDDRDALGTRRVKLHWELGPDDRARYRQAVELLAQQFGFAGAGWIRLDPPNFGSPRTELFYGAHHMGTTRMHTDPKRGVVDVDCKVHGIENLYVAGSSVFPAVGYSNPTLTILALTLRLADHLASRLR
jgi:choline dehydrogenase-like flavoprotein